MQENAYTRDIVRKRTLFFGAAACITALLDGVLKGIANRHFSSDTMTPDWPVALGLHKNPGVIFDIPLPYSVLLPFTAVVCIYLLHLAAQKYREHPHASIALWFVVVGAFGNGSDRLLHGYTTDYLIFFQRSAINLSDILILTGAIAYMYYSERRPPAGANN